MFRKYNGDYLITIFKELEIDISDLDPNTIRGWFDTDEKEMLDCLNLMCSLSKKNVLELHEQNACTFLKENEENISKNIDPNIFQHESNEILLKVASKELELIRNEEDQLDKLIEINSNLNRHLSCEQSELIHEEYSIDSQLNDTKINCEQLACNLDRKLVEIFEKLSGDSSEIRESLSFLNRKKFCDNDDIFVDIREILEKYEENLMFNFPESEINLNSTAIEENVLSGKFDELKMSFLKYFNTKNELMNENSIISLEKLADEKSHKLIQNIQNKMKQNDLILSEKNLIFLGEISNFFMQFLTFTTFNLDFLSIEKKSLENSLEIMKKIQQFSRNYQNLTDRIEEMLVKSEKIKEYSKTVILINHIMKFHKKNSIEQTYSSHLNFDKNVEFSEKKNFKNGFIELSQTLNDFFKNNKIETFLSSSNTNQCVVVPTNLKVSLKQIALNLKEQEEKIKFILQLVGKTLRKLNSNDESTKNLRYFWIYFMSNDKKFLELKDRK